MKQERLSNKSVAIDPGVDIEFSDCPKLLLSWDNNPAVKYPAVKYPAFKYPSPRSDSSGMYKS
jgi:hypothetical protein